jgi:hypothetical protein
MAETDPSSKSTADLVKRQTELAVRLGKLGKEVTKCSTELEAITKELEQRVANDSELDEQAAEAPVLSRLLAIPSLSLYSFIKYYLFMIDLLFIYVRRQALPRRRRRRQLQLEPRTRGTWPTTPAPRPPTPSCEKPPTRSDRRKSTSRVPPSASSSTGELRHHQQAAGAVHCVVNDWTDKQTQMRVSSSS